MSTDRIQLGSRGRVVGALALAGLGAVESCGFPDHSFLDDRAFYAAHDASTAVGGGSQGASGGTAADAAAGGASSRGGGSGLGGATDAGSGGVRGVGGGLDGAAETGAAGSDGGALATDGATASEGGPDGGDGTAVGALGTPCSSNGSYACAGHAGRGQVACVAGAWAPNGTCPANNNCDSAVGTNSGFCSPVVPECSAALPGAIVCRGLERLKCGPDLVTTTPVDTCTSQACVSGACIGVCTPDATRCSVNTPEKCGSAGDWQPQTPCSYVCSQGACTGTCVPTTTQPCGAASTCNPSATETCDATGFWGACTPAPLTTCAPGQVYPCTTCSSLPAFAAGTEVCSASCDFAGSTCVPPNLASYAPYSANPSLTHDCGAVAGSYWNVPSGTGPCYAGRGPFATLPAGHYQVTFSFYGASQGNVTLDVTSGGQCGGALGGLCPVSVNPYNALSVHDFTYEFDVLTPCATDWEIRIYKEGAAGSTYYYQTTLEYLHP